MANPAARNGHIDVANELAEKFATVSLTGQEWRVLWVILRQTWGYKVGERKRDAHAVSSRFIAKATGMNRVNVRRCLRSLAAARVILEHPSGIGLNQNHEEWVVVKRLPGGPQTPGSQKTPTPGSQETPQRGSQETPKRKIKDSIKDNIATPRVAKPIQEHLIPLAVFTACSKPRFDNQKQLDSWISRNLRSSKRLAGFSPRQVATAYAYAVYEREEFRKKNRRTYDISLETVEKKIAEHKDDDPGGRYEEAIVASLALYEGHKDLILSRQSPFLLPI